MLLTQSPSNSADVDDLTRICLRIHQTLGYSLKRLLQLYLLVDPEKFLVEKTERGRIVERLREGLHTIDSRWHSQCFSAKTSARVDRLIDRCGRAPIHILHPYSSEYPERLLHIPDRPIILFTRGDWRSLNALQVAIVGSRRATPPALKFAESVSDRISSCGVVITSGLAHGCDIRSHLGVVRPRSSEKPDINRRTNAVLGSGVEVIYPARHREIAEEMIRLGGCLVSELEPDASPQAKNFPKRNRILAGLVVAVIVVEAGLKSGSLISARLANEYGREVFAVPGSPENTLARGCHFLIKAGAHLLEEAGDLAEALGNRWPQFQKLLATDTTAAVPASVNDNPSVSRMDRQKIPYFLKQIHANGVNVEEYARLYHLNLTQAYSVLTDLELDGLVSQSLSGKYYKSS